MASDTEVTPTHGDGDWWTHHQKNFTDDNDGEDDDDNCDDDDDNCDDDDDDDGEDDDGDDVHYHDSNEGWKERR